jgi:hypothetical protein
MFLTQQCLFLSNQDGMMIHESSNITPPTPLILDYQSNNQLKQLPMSPVFFILICIRNNALLVGNVDLSTQHLFHQWHELLASNHLIHMSGPSFEVRAGPAAATPHGVLSCRFIGGATELNGIPVGNRRINKLQRLLTLW